MDLTLQQLLFRLLALLLVAAVHGWTLAAAAGLMGDDGPRHDGRRTLDPFAHLSLLGSLCGVLFGLGWIKPLVLDHDRLRAGRKGSAIVALAGLAAVLGLAAAAPLLRQPVLLAASGNLPLQAVVLLETVGSLALGFTLLNLVPLPPLTGAHILAALAPGLERRLRRLEKALAPALAILLASGLASSLLSPVLRPLARLLPGG